MASGVMRSAIASIQDDPDFTIESAKAESTKELATSLLAAIVHDEPSIELFASVLLCKIQGISSVSSKYCSREVIKYLIMCFFSP